MWDTLVQAVIERREEVALLPDWVKSWVVFMRLLFFGGVIFAFWWKFPRYVILVMILTAVVILSLKILAPELDTIAVGTVSQLILWVPLLAYLFFGRQGGQGWRGEILAPLKSGRPFSIVYGIWVSLVAVTLIVSFGFNLVGAIKLF